MQPNGGLNTQNTTRRMAKAMFEITRDHGCCTDRDLITIADFTPAEVRVHGLKATELATAMAQAA